GATATALEYIEKGKAIYDHENHNAGKAHAFKLMGDCYVRQGKYYLARQHYLTALDAAKAANSRIVKADIYEELGKLALHNQDYKTAYDIKATQLSWRDSIVREQKALLLAENEWRLN